MRTTERSFTSQSRAGMAKESAVVKEVRVPRETLK